MESEIPELNDREWLQTQVEEQFRSATDVADELDCNAKTVVNWVMYHDLELPTVAPQSTYDELNDADWLREQIVERERTLEQIADELGCRTGTVSNWVIRHGIEERTDQKHNRRGNRIRGLNNVEDGENPAWARTGRPWQDAEQLRRAYWEYYWSPREIAEWVADDVSPTSVRRDCERKLEDVRSYEESMTVTKLRNRGASLERLRREVPPPSDDDDESGGEEIETGVEWGRLVAGD